MLKKKVTKLWKGQYVSVRDYEVEGAKRQGGLVVEYNNKKMTLGLDRLNLLKPDGRVFKSKTGGRNYRLVDVVFQADIVNEGQRKLL